MRKKTKKVRPFIDLYTIKSNTNICKQCYNLISYLVFYVKYSGGSRLSDKGRGAGHPDPEIRWGGGSLKKKFSGPSGLILV